MKNYKVVTNLTPSFPLLHSPLPSPLFTTSFISEIPKFPFTRCQIPRKGRRNFEKMACMGEENWVSLSRLSLDQRGQRNPEAESIDGHHGNGEIDGGIEENNVLSNGFAYKFERVFPVYARGSSRPDPTSVSYSVSGSGSGDPIWASIREEAKSEAEKEPILSSFLYASVLSHDSLERTLGFVLANRLQNPTLLATQLMDTFCDVIMNDKGIQRSIRLDVQAFKQRDPSSLSSCWVLLYLKGYHSLQSYRVAHALWNQGRRLLAMALQSRISEVFGVDIHPAAKIGDGILLDHATGVVIGETAVIGNRVSIMQGVTLGGTGKENGDRHPKVGDGALIGASATILGNITIGEGAMVAAGSLVLKDVPPHSMVAGIPAKVIAYIDEQDPSLTMKHDAPREFFEQAAGGPGEGR